MSDIKIKAISKNIKGEIVLTAGKSESNRVLMIRALCGEEFEIENLALAKDTRTMRRLLSSKGVIKDVGPAGTTMRFLTAYYANTPGEYILTGSERMKNRPIKILVDALKSLGAEIAYMEKEGCPPLKIAGKPLNGGKVVIDGSVSSQYLSALIMIAPTLKGGLELELVGKIASVPYLRMTLELIKDFGVNYTWEGQIIRIPEGTYQAKPHVIEADWSAASYWYQIAALAQQDRIVLRKIPNFKLPSELVYDFSDCPDVAQTLAATVAGLGIGGSFTGLESLRIKETDRIEAIKKELGKFNIAVEILGEDAIKILPGVLKRPKKAIATYDDHRVAMSIAPLCLCLEEEIELEDEEVVAKSYPDYWKDLSAVGLVSELIS